MGMSRKLLKLIEKLRGKVISDTERAAQRISFAYGNVKLHNDKITREMVEEQSDNVDRKIEEE